MCKLSQIVTILVTCLFALGGCATTSTESAPAAVATEGAETEVKASPCATCAKGKNGETVWCNHCNAGFANGKKMKCQGCWKQKAEGAPACAGCAKQTMPTEAAENTEGHSAEAPTAEAHAQDAVAENTVN